MAEVDNKLLNVTIENEVITVILDTLTSTSGLSTPHDILSTTHTDTVVDTPVKGDLLVVNADGEFERLPVGAEGEVLKIISGVPDYGAGSGGGGAPVEASYVALSNHVDLTNERVLTGVANQITVNDNGAGNTVVLSLPQNIHTGASPTFAGAMLTGNLSKVYNVPYVWPASQGGAATFLRNDGAGNMSWTVVGGAPTTSQYVTLATDSTLTAERVLTAGNGVQILDGGANNPVTLATRQQHSIIQSSGILQLSGDVAAPGGLMVYGTNSGGTKGWVSSTTGGLRSATKIVAASNSLDKTKADYVCTGTTDAATINAALAFGGHIKLMEGTFNLENCISILSNTWLQGSGPATILKYTVNRSANWLTDIRNTNLESDVDKDMMISDLTIDGNAVGQTYQQMGINFRRAERVEIRNVKVYNCRGWNIRIDQTPYSVISDSISLGYNTFPNGGSDALHYVGSSHHGVLTNCIIDGGYDDTIAISSELGVPHDITITNCVIKAPTVVGRSIWIGNEIEGQTSPYNIQVSNCIITAGRAVVCQGLASSYCSNIQMDNIIFQNCSEATLGAVFFQWTNKSQFNNIKLISPSGVGIWCSTCNDIQINNAQIENAGLNGIYFFETTHSQIQGCHVTGSSYGAIGTWSGIYLNTSNYNFVSGNMCRANSKAKYGITVAGGTRNVLHGNDLYASGTTSDINDSGTGTLKRDNGNNAGTGWITDV